MLIDISSFMFSVEENLKKFVSIVFTYTYTCVHEASIWFIEWPHMIGS